MTLDQPPHTDDLDAKRQVLSKTVIRAADRLGLTTAELVRIIGLSPASVSRLRSGDYALDPSTKSWELVCLAISFARNSERL